MMDPAARRLDEAALLRRCERLVPGHAERAVETYRGARQGRGAEVTPPALWFAIDSDRAFRYPAMRLAELHRTHQPDTYAYLFTWPSPFMNGALGACHALELPFVFGTLSDPMLMNLTGTGAAAHRLAERIQEAWISFARSGQPSADWPAYDPAQRATMLINDEWEVAHAPLEAERRFWETVS
jgi:para-nitrobenzyl esterase